MSQGIFPSTLLKCNVELSMDENIAHKINTEHPLILRQLELELSNDNDLNQFCQEMTTYLQDEINLRLAISNTKTICSKTNRERKQKSIMNLFVTIVGLQKEALQILIKKLPERIVEHDIAFVNDALTSISYLPKVDEAYLASHLVQMLDVAEIDLKLEILKYLTKIVRNISDEVAQNLLTLIAENEVLAEQILRCLKLLGYSQEVKTSILVFIHNRLLGSQRYHKIFPTILEFLLKKYDDIVQIVEKTLPIMDKVMSTDIADDVKLALHKILVTSIGSRSLTPKLYSTLLTYSSDETKPIQIYIFLLLFASDSLKSKSVDLVIKKKVRTQNFKRELWESFFASYFIEETFEYLQSTILRIAFSLIESQTPKNTIFGDVGILIFKQLFTNKFCNELMKKHMISQVGKNLNRDINNKNVKTLLRMLLDMSKEKLLVEHCGHLMSFVELHAVLSPTNMKYVFEIVCENVVKDEHMVDELRQDISKLLMAIKETQMKKGVIGAVTLAKYQTKGGSSTTTLDETNASLSAEQLTGTLQLAMDLLKFTKEMCHGNCGPLGLYYDELAMALTSDTDSKLLYLLHCDVQNVFENTFIGENQQETGLRVPLKVQFELNRPGDAVPEIYIKIGNLVQDPSQAQRSKVMVLPPVFRFLRKVTAFRNHGQMDSIDAVLGFGVSLPDIEDVDMFGQADLPIVANCLFHCINWFRELVSAFVLLSGDETRFKVIQRIGHIISLEDKLDAVMDLIPDHKLPQSYFYDESEGPRDVAGPGPTRSAPKRAKYDSTINSTAAITTRRKGFKKRYYDFREMDSNVMSLLRHPVSAENITTTQAQTFRSQQFQFILRDAIGKLASSMDLRSKTETLNEVTAAELLKGMEKLMKYVNKQFRLVTRDIALLMENNKLEDSPAFFTPRATDLKVSFDLVINLYKLIFSWDGFHQTTHHELLRKYFLYFDAAETSTLATQTQQLQATQLSQRSQLGRHLNRSNLLMSLTMMRDLKNCFIENMSKYKEQCLLLSSASALLAVLTSIRDHMEHNRNDADKVIVKTAQTFLKRSWISLSGAPEHDKEANDNLARIIEAYFGNAKVETIKGIVNTLTIEVKDFKSKKDSMHTFKAIDKSNINIFIKCVCNALHAKLRSEVATVLPQEQLFLWQQGLHTLQSLIDVAKALGSIKNLRTLLTTCHSIMLAFLKSGFETIKACLKKKPDDVQALFTTWEGIFRYMHRLTCEAFDKRMKAFLNLVPKVRAALQTFVQQVKSVLTTFKCTVAFFEAVLVNKNLDGAQIMTQTSSTTESDDEEDQGDVDDGTEAGSTSNYSAAHSEQSASEIYE